MIKRLFAKVPYRARLCVYRFKGGAYDRGVADSNLPPEAQARIQQAIEWRARQRSAPT